MFSDIYLIFYIYLYDTYTFFFLHLLILYYKYYVHIYINVIYIKLHNICSNNSTHSTKSINVLP